MPIVILLLLLLFTHQSRHGLLAAPVPETHRLASDRPPPSTPQGPSAQQSASFSQHGVNHTMNTTQTISVNTSRAFCTTKCSVQSTHCKPYHEHNTNHLCQYCRVFQPTVTLNSVKTYTVTYSMNTTQTTSVNTARSFSQL